MKQNFMVAIFLVVLFLSNPYQGTSQGIKGKDARRYTFRITNDKLRFSNEESQGSKVVVERKKEEGRGIKKLIVMVGQRPLSAADPEVLAAMDFIRRLNSYSFRYSTFQEIKRHPEHLHDAAVVWFHRSDSAMFSNDESDNKVIKLLYEYMEKGGHILLTLDAFPYINMLGVETSHPSVKLKASVDEGYGRKLGFHAYLGHPLFTGLNGGAYIYKPTSDITVRVNGFFGDTLPAFGKVVAIDWDYIFFREDSKVIVEYEVGKGKLLAVGAYTLFSVPNVNRLHLESFSTNILDYLTGKLEVEPRFYWDYSPPVVVSCPEKVQNRDVLFEAIPEAVTWVVKPDPLVFPLHNASHSYCEAAGERILIMGQEKGGIEEVWTHPFMALRDFESGIRFNRQTNLQGEAEKETPGSDSTIWLNDLTPEIEIRPDGFIRHYNLERGILHEITSADPVLPCGVVHYSWNGKESLELSVRFRTNLRLMWPYPASSIGSICHGWDPDFNSFCFSDKSGKMSVMVGGNKIPIKHEASQGDGFIVDAGVSYSLEPGESLDMVIVSGTLGIEEATATFDKAIRDPYGIFLRSRKHTDAIIRESLTVTTPDQNFNLGYQWSLLGTDRFFVTTPGMGSALVAGYGTSRRGWDGAQKVSGRPGYAWYFGRDGQWSGFALLDYGDFEKVKKNLEFYLKYQNLNGKIFHEATTSGVIHYDAADATPLFLILAGNYLLKSGDTEFIRANWRSIKKAIDFCFSTDTDQDHLIENTHVGHGWVEGGKLFGSHSSFYLTGCWVAALEAAKNMADAAEDDDALMYKQEAKIVRNLVDLKFWNSRERFYAYGLNKDGSQRTDPTILPTVPAYFGITDKDKMRFLLDYYASNAFSTNWGTRIISEENPMFKPAGYHYGSVWPLFTGWTSLAEYRYGNHIQGYTHIMNNLNVFRNWGLGFVEEVLNGEEYLPSGVCPHQCWSETMVLQPVIEGMLGISVDARTNTLNFSPSLPADWDNLKVTRIRIGDQFVNVTFQRDSFSMRWQFTRSGSKPVSVDMMQSLPPATKVGRVWVNRKELPFATFTTSRFISLQVNFVIDGTTTIEVDYSGGILVLPNVPSPLPGSRAEGLRIIDANLKGESYDIDIEGLAGSSDTLSVWSYYTIDEAVKNAKPLSRNGYATKFLVDFETGEKKYVKKQVIISISK